MRSGIGRGVPNGAISAHAPATPYNVLKYRHNIFLGDSPATVLNMFKPWRRPRRQLGCLSVSASDHCASNGDLVCFEQGAQKGRISLTIINITCSCNKLDE